ncbi:hypothetical protein DJ530_00080 [Sulfolobus sp. E1]|nr:hypothetical protein DJ532_14280 [Sulfolobus sp. A20-N-F8]TRM79453.1 hypothetical protein DJ528_01035 [Sulfolobus sp. B5]TRM82378.1 hypothetical protein DJ524_00880 [Sulfolobus sp. D5]TRM84628.1 hypothetical protein DJ522_04015 [Sulfolobus sp. F3]TRM88986.1 hypothetical protein DJ529_03625 [Sulfolobus sp. C3]TRM89327.1 hypothetical protein DJ521_00055 [Sulfolobus sp. E3]TRM95197.1 hypothetical protein DJ526_01015 [Sulfolobus sp. A20-N-G8]TRN01856.1 hypothetical protein DJ527_04755 [Sulfol
MRSLVTSRSNQNSRTFAYVDVFNVLLPYPLPYILTLKALSYSIKIYIKITISLTLNVIKVKVGNLT